MRVKQAVVSSSSYRKGFLLDIILFEKNYYAHL